MQVAGMFTFLQLLLGSNSIWDDMAMAWLLAPQKGTKNASLELQKVKHQASHCLIQEAKMTVKIVCLYEN